MGKGKKTPLPFRYAGHLGRKALRKGEKELGRSGDPALEGAERAKRASRQAIRLLARIKKLFRKIAFFFGIIAFLIIVIFMLLMAFAALLTASGNAAGELIYGVITDEEIGEHIKMLNEKGKEKYEEAISIALSSPSHDDAHVDKKGLFPDEAREGVSLYHYGSPREKDDPDRDIYHNRVNGETKGGYHIYYLDSYGNTIGLKTSNTKDVLCLSSVMIENDYDEEAAEKAPELFDFWFQKLNPKPHYTVSELYDKEGSDRFPYGEEPKDGESYCCNDAAFYETYEKALSDGVKFYETPAERTEKGCTFDEAAYQAAVSSFEETGEDGTAPEIEDYYYCPGHEALSCSYGYRDVNIYVTILTKEDVYAASETGEITYLVPEDYTLTSWRKEKVDLLLPEDLKELTKPHDRDGGFGNPKRMDWCDNLYAQDWFDLYGVDPYGDNAPLDSPEGKLSGEQIKEMMDSIKDVPEIRKEIISFALSQVGRIPYYWGGKASVSGFEGNGFGSYVKPDYKGRNKRGLDCSGFVSWVYWSVVSPGSRSCPCGMSTGSFPGSLGLKRISASELMPGDIGLEAPPGDKSNHIGYFAGYDENGKANWVHCSGSSGVTCNTTNGFRIYYRLF